MQKKQSNILDNLSSNSKVSLRFAERISKDLFSKGTQPIHLLVGILLNKECLGSKTIEKMDHKIDDIVTLLIGPSKFKLDRSLKSSTEVTLSDESKEVIRFAYSLASRMSHVYVGTEHLILSLLKKKELKIVKTLAKIGIDYHSYEETLLNFATYPLGLLAKPQSVGNQMVEQSILSILGVDIVDRAKKGKLDPVIGREQELDSMLNILSRRKKNNVVVVGESGVGKTAMVEALAQRIVEGNVPLSLRKAKIISLDISNIIAGSKMRGDVEEKMMAVIDEVTSSPNTILFIDEIHTILGPAIPGTAPDIASILKPALVRDDFRCIGATTTSEYTKYFEEDAALVRRFQPVMLEEVSIEESVKILKRIKPVLEKHHGVVISKDAIDSAVRLSDRYVSDRYLPDKAIDLLDEASATRKLQAEAQHSDFSLLLDKLYGLERRRERAIKKGEMTLAKRLDGDVKKIKVEIGKQEEEQDKTRKSKEFEVSVETIGIVVSKWTGIPVATLGSKELSSLLKLEQTIGKGVIGQSEAVENVSAAIKRARTGISSEERPWASFLFLGPTGVGKTELAKVLTKELFGSKDRLIQIDMSEMMEMHSISKLIGSPPGYVGYREGGQLTEMVRKHPHCVVLFDEIEKAHEDVLNILLQILEYGHLTDGKGRKVSFKNCVIILTSNIGAEDIRKDKVLGFTGISNGKERTDNEIEEAYDTMREELFRTLRTELRPELINRLDDIIIFRALTRKDARKIVDLLVKDLNIRLKDQRIRVKLDKGVKDYIVEDGFSEEYGARPLRRSLQDNLETVLAEYLLKSGGEIQGSKKIVEVVVTVKDDKLVISL